MTGKEIAELAVEFDKAGDRLRRSQFSIADSFGLKRGERIFLMVLSNLSKLGPVRPSHLAKEMDVTLPLVSHRIDALEKKGLILRTPSNTDKRTALIELTESGRDMTRKINEDCNKRLRRLVEYLGNDDAANYIRIQKLIAEFYLKQG